MEGEASLKRKRKEEETALLQCPICMDVWQEPVTLSCSHTFCAKCLADVKKQTCPLCIAPILGEPVYCRALVELACHVDGSEESKKRLETRTALSLPKQATALSTAAKAQLAFQKVQEQYIQRAFDILSKNQSEALARAETYFEDTCWLCCSQKARAPGSQLVAECRKKNHPWTQTQAIDRAHENKDIGGQNDSVLLDMPPKMRQEALQRLTDMGYQLTPYGKYTAKEGDPNRKFIQTTYRVDY